MLRFLLLLLVAGVLHAQPIQRSQAEVRAFKKANPCPSTGRTYGPCFGYVIDHIEALACGGPDAPVNMQWQTVEDAKAKDKWERIGCQRPKPKRANPP